MKKKNESAFIRSLLLPLGLGFIVFALSQCSYITTSIEEQNFSEGKTKQKGAHLFGRLDTTNLQLLKKHNFEWITLVSYASQEEYNTPKVSYFRGDSLEMARRDSSWASRISLAHASGFKVFLKPHIWLHEATDGKWRSDIFFENEEDWIEWQQAYRAFILHYAKIAEKNKVELFCIGAEFTRLTLEKTEYWSQLIEEVRATYSGEITYAANWYQEYEKIKFWDKLDYIGIQAYFPLVKNEYPTVEEISDGWKDCLPALEEVYKKYNRKILFTEMGYKSTSDSAIEPWRWMEHSSDYPQSLSMETQANCYQAFFNTVWNKEWMSGVHIWQMRGDFKGINDYNDMDFTPQDKLAEKVIAEGFKK